MPRIVKESVVKMHQDHYEEGLIPLSELVGRITGEMVREPNCEKCGELNEFPLAVNADDFYVDPRLHPEKVARLICPACVRGRA